nr:MAG TPA: hypothetical protein [Caudoviricetes sp.]
MFNLSDFVFEFFDFIRQFGNQLFKSSSNRFIRHKSFLQGLVR